MLFWLLTLPASGVVSIVTTTPGYISLIARLYLLAARMSLTTEESLLFAGRALQNLLQLPQSAWAPEFTNELDKTHPSVVNDILYRVIKDTERRPMNCPALKGGFIILSNICRAPVLNRMLIREDAVYWICRAIHNLSLEICRGHSEDNNLSIQSSSTWFKDPGKKLLGGLRYDTNLFASDKYNNKKWENHEKIMLGNDVRKKKEGEMMEENLAITDTDGFELQCGKDAGEEMRAGGIHARINRAQGQTEKISRSIRRIFLSKSRYRKLAASNQFRTGTP
ncbi:uncharacterized protein C8R40DRAFT_1217163 [Lentinula edodes]|uniref:uncharacterized protein n=1 Tax=Lentinula edodes TaxID=5353 RepID=UPI001E8E6046|nr:uncharacterized protein C8R40DRAFT_1217163 [Lentinula edodes]KAH7869341.1 hypothetical protein C8R40DRAFT_1217163 [Lentinula edodes]